MMISVAGGRPPRKARAASSRAAADVDVTMRTHLLLPDAMPDHRDTRGATPRRNRSKRDRPERATDRATTATAQNLDRQIRIRPRHLARNDQVLSLSGEQQQIRLHHVEVGEHDVERRK